MKSMDTLQFAEKERATVLKDLGVKFENGLTQKEVIKRQETHGLNAIRLKETTGWHILIRQFKSAFVYLLLSAMVITIILGETVDTVMILLFIVINTGLGFYQEYSSEKTAKLLNSYALPRAKVKRSNKLQQITADQLVFGDIVRLETGDKVPADIRLLEVDDFSVNETVLTGESVSVFKNTDTLHEAPASYHEATNLAFSGTDVLKGEAWGVVVATGKSTAFGSIAELAGETRKVSDFEQGISKFSSFILKLIGATLVAVFVAHLMMNRDGVDMIDLIFFSVALTVSVIPEALPLVTTFSLSRGAKRLARRKVLVKRLSAIEDLGGIEVLCSDKTGTLTKNEMQIIDTLSGNSEQTVWLANLASSFELAQKVEPFDIALEAGLNDTQRQNLKKAKKIFDEAFDPTTRMNSVVVEDGKGIRVIIRGAPESVIEHCKVMNETARKEAQEWIHRHGTLGHRVLAVASKEVKIDAQGEDIHDSELQRNDFEFSGIISFEDPIKESTVSAVAQARKLGVRIVIITGDSPTVAGAVAKGIGLIDFPDSVITGREWQAADDHDRDSFLQHGAVFARVTPEEKYDIINALRQKYMIGFLGEGINDAPALKAAGVSLVVNSASDIAREAADIILLKKNLEVIIEGIKEGRQVFANTTKYIKSTLASNFGNFFAVATASLLVDFLPMLPIQILLVNLLSDTPMISISTDTVDPSELKSPRKYTVKDIIVIAIILGLVSTVFDFIFFGAFYRISPGVLQTNWFIGSILTELVLLFSIRTKSLFIKSKRPSTSIIVLSVLTFILTIGLPYTPFGQSVFKFVPPTGGHLVFIISMVVLYFIISETVKLFYYRTKPTEIHSNS